MELLILPAEILKAILVEAVKCRTINRALRLRLVSRKFSDDVIDAICTTKLLDGCTIRIGDCPIAAFYVERRILRERSNAHPEIDHLRRIAQTLAAHEPSNIDTQDAVFQDHVARLCALLDKDKYLCHVLTPPMRNLESGFRYDLLTAAVIVGKEELVAQLASSVNKNGSRLFENDHVTVTAVYMRNHRMLDILFESMENRSIMDFRRYRVLREAAARGQIDTVHHILESNWAPSNTGARWGDNIFDRSLYTPSIQIFNTILAAREKVQSKVEIPQELLEWLLCGSVDNGWIDMTRHLISIGAPLTKILSGASKDNIDITKVCKAGYKDTIQLLLDHGAIITEEAIIAAARHGHIRLVEMFYNYSLRSGDAMSAAAQRGHLNIVRWLLDRGEDVNAGAPPPVVWAVQHEDTAMFRYLIEQGAVLNTSTGGEAARMAKDTGLESMLALLQKHGVDLPDDSTV